MLKRYVSINRSVFVIDRRILAKDEPGSTKIRAFDLDSTLIQTRSGKVFPINADDYQWGIGVLIQLKKLHDDGYTIVIFSNQSGISDSSSGKKKLSMMYTKINNLIKELGTKFKNIIFFMAAKNDWNRKPSPGMWYLFIKHFNNGTVPTDSLFVGDAAGRPNDFSCSDRKFAKNAEIKFETPEHFFQKLPEEDFEWGGYDPQAILKFPTTQGITVVFPKTQELLIAVGFPGAGKSSWYITSGCEKAGYVRINQDELVTPSKCKKMCKTTLEKKKSVYVDNTNLSVNTRNEYISMAKKEGIPVRCVWFNSSIELCQHLNKCRAYLQKKTAIPIAVKKYTQPDIKEGFNEIVTIPFVPVFKDDRSLRVFKYRF
jgi:bifunctional polynucleotide phosphatase/kinase